MAPKLSPQARRAKTRAESSVAGALKCSSRAADVNRALLSVVVALFPGQQKEKQVHAYHTTARAAFTRYLREQAGR
jgi:hypothetical protein